jgi:glyoxylase-like metal-dependent hydrolase (beta-lactamase superfamily II)
MDQAALEEFSGTKYPFPYWPALYARARLALRGASIVVLTHEHYDHAVGIERGPELSGIIPNVVLSAAQLHTLLAPPSASLGSHPVYLQLSADQARAYRTIDFDQVFALAPGVALIRAPGHTPGSQMVYVRLQSGREVLLVGDIVWNLEGVRSKRQKPDSVAQSLAEDRTALQHQIDWLHEMITCCGIVVVPAHDDRWLDQLAQDGVLASDVDLDRP